MAGFQLKSSFDLRAATAALKGIDPKIAKAAHKKGMTALGRVIRDKAKALAPRDSGQLKKAMGDKVKTYKRGSVVTSVVGPRNDAKATKKRPNPKAKFRKLVKRKSGANVMANPAHYAHLVEKGRKAVSVKNARFLTDGAVVYGVSVGPAAPRPFLTPALRQNRALAMRAYEAALRAAVARLTGGTP